MGPVAGLSIVCCFNDPAVREDCLDRSLAAYDGTIDIDYIPVDNTEQVHTTAGSALNHGAHLARHDVVVFVHQDVYLHSIDRLAEALAPLLGEQWGMLGACGVGAEPGQWFGRLRDRLELICTPAVTPRDVDSLDEVLFAGRRERLLADPISEDADLAWHAYGVEYGARMRSLGLRVGAVDCAVTHNSLTINLARLDVAHRRVAALHPDLLPMRTTCGDIGVEASSSRLTQQRRWARWLVDSAKAARVRRATGLPVVLADLRHEADLVDYSASAPLRVVNLDSDGAFHGEEAPLDLLRAGRPITVSTAASVDDLIAQAAATDPSHWLALTNLPAASLPAARLPRGWRWVIGLQSLDPWLLGIPEGRHLPQAWLRRRAVPLGQRSPSP